MLGQSHFTDVQVHVLAKSSSCSHSSRASKKLRWHLTGNPSLAGFEKHNSPQTCSWILQKCQRRLQKLSFLSLPQRRTRPCWIRPWPCAAGRPGTAWQAGHSPGRTGRNGLRENGRRLGLVQIRIPSACQMAAFQLRSKKGPSANTGWATSEGSPPARSAAPDSTAGEGRTEQRALWPRGTGFCHTEAWEPALTTEAVSHAGEERVEGGGFHHALTQCWAGASLPAGHSPAEYQGGLKTATWLYSRAVRHTGALPLLRKDTAITTANLSSAVAGMLRQAIWMSLTVVCRSLRSAVRVLWFTAGEERSQQC